MSVSTDGQICFGNVYEEGFAKPKSEVRYFLVERDHLSAHGNENGSDKAEAERLLAECGEDVGQLVVIRGIVIKPSFILEDQPKEPKG